MESKTNSSSRMFLMSGACAEWTPTKMHLIFKDLEPTTEEEGKGVTDAVVELTKQTFNNITDDERFVWKNSDTEIEWKTSFHAEEIEEGTSVLGQPT